MVCAIVLAAGESRRMGTQKLLLPYGGKPLIAHVVDQIAHGAVNEILVVVGNDGERITGALTDRPVRIVANLEYKTGMLSSVRCGLLAAPPQCGAVLVALGDQPSITTYLVDEMLRAFSACGKPILVPAYDGRRGHPLLFSTRFRDEILAGYDSTGLRGLLQSHSEDVFEMPVSTSSILSDVDTPDDYRRALESLHSL